MGSLDKPHGGVGVGVGVNVGVRVGVTGVAVASALFVDAT